LCLVVAAMVGCNSTISSIIFMLCYFYMYQLYIMMFINTRQVMYAYGRTS
jgi:hypothetical protein